MKRIASIFALGLALLMVSCLKDDAPMTGPVNEINDLYTPPAGAVELPGLTVAQSTWSTDRRYFDLSFGSSLATTLVGYDALLAPGQYLLGADEIGKAVLAKTTVNGAPAKEGFITVGKRDGQYTLIAQINGSVFTWKGTLPFVDDPAPLALTVLRQASANKDSQLVTVQLAESGVESGSGKYLALDLYSSDGYLHDGAYVASAEGGVVNAGEFGIGWDPGDLWNIGFEFTNWGTCLWTVSGETSTAEKITEGLVTVSGREEKVDGKDVTIWTIYWGKDYPRELLFEGAIPTLTKSKKPEGGGVSALDYAYAEELDEPAGGVVKHKITITDKDDNVKAYLELLMAEGATDYSGAYPSTSYASEAGQMADGWEIPDWNMGGGSYFMDSDGNKVLMLAGEWTVTVTKIAEGAYKFAWEGYEYDAAGPDFVPGGGDIEALPATDVVTDNGGGVDKHSISINDGEETVAYFELLTATGDDIVGTFVSTEYAADPGMLCNGWEFPDWGIGGGSYVMLDGAKVLIEPGVTIEVTKLADSIYKFTGPDYEFVANVTR